MTGHARDEPRPFRVGDLADDEPQRAPFRSGRALAWVASCGVSLSVLASVALSVIEVANVLYPDLLHQIVHEDTGVVVLSLVLVGATIALFFATLFGTVSFLVWFYRAADNARAIGQRRLRTTPWSAVLWWFVPLANLVRPYRAVKAVYWASETRTANLTGDLVARAPGIFPLWWGSWLIGVWLQNISARLSLADGLGAGAMWTGIVALPFTFVSALCIIAIVWSIENRQEQLALFGRAEWPNDEDRDEDEDDQDDQDDQDNQDDAPSSR